MRRTALLLLAFATAGTLGGTPANASIYCGYLVGDVPAFGPVCLAKCVLAHEVDPKNIKESLEIVCPA
jgi:hypothetical protein